LIRIPQTDADWRLLIFAISIWGYVGNWLCCHLRHTHPQWRIFNVNANDEKQALDWAFSL